MDHFMRAKAWTTRVSVAPTMQDGVMHVHVEPVRIHSHEAVTGGWYPGGWYPASCVSVL